MTVLRPAIGSVVHDATHVAHTGRVVSRTMTNVVIRLPNGKRARIMHHNVRQGAYQRTQFAAPVLPIVRRRIRHKQKVAREYPVAVLAFAARSGICPAEVAREWRA